MLLSVKGECYYDEEVGTEYYPSIGEKNIETLKVLTADSISNVKGVKDIVSFTAEIINNTRSLKIDFEVTDDLGNLLTITETIEV